MQLRLAKKFDDDVSPVDIVPDELADQLMARHVEVQSLADLMGSEHQRGTPIPALQNTFYKFVQNPSTVSVETFKRMIDTDETVGSGVDFLASCLVARMGAYQNDDDDIAAFVNKALSEMEGGEVDTYKEMLSAAWAGFSISENVWANKSIGFVPDRIVSLPPTSILFSVDRTGRLEDDGVLQYQRNYNPAMAQGIGGFGAGILTPSLGFTPRPDPLAKFGDMPYPIRSPSTFNYLSIRIPKMKCVHFAWNSQGRFGNPYGRSMLRRCYNWWVMKWAFCQMLGVALDRKGTPLMIGFADANATMQSGHGYKSKTPNTRENTLKAPQAMADAFKNIHNDTFVTLPGMKGKIFDIEKIDQTSNAQDFISAIQLCNTLQMRGLLIPALVFSSGDGAGSYALGTEHAKTFDKILDGYLEGFKRTLLEQVVKQIVAYNFPKAKWQKAGLGSFAKRELTTDERQKEADMFLTAVNLGVVDVNDLGDLNKMREAMGFEPRLTPIEKPDPFGSMEFDDNGDPVQSDGEEPEPEGKKPVGKHPFGGGSNGSGTGRPGAAKPTRARAAKDAGKTKPR